MENITQGQWFSAAASSDVGDSIDQSLRFINVPNGSESVTLTRSASSVSTWTASVWAKHAGLANGYLFGNGSNEGFRGGNSTTDSRPNFFIDSNHRYVTAEHNDPSAWYHYVLTYDGSNLKIYVNGALDLTYATGNGNLTVSKIGGWNGSIGFGGYLADFHFIDGSAKNPTDFGKYNNAGVWVPQNYSGTYGSNGWHLTFDSTQSNGIGHDSSGNGNHWTANSFETAALSSSNFQNDINYNDTPTNNYSTLNSVNLMGSKNVKNANLTVYATGSGVTDVSGTIPASLFDCYFEVNNASGSGLRGVGIGDYRARISQGTGSYITYRENGSIVRYPGNNNVGSESSYTTDDVIGVAVTSTQVSFYKNGTLEGTYTHSQTGDFFPIGMAYYSSGNAELDFNFGQHAFRHSIPSGFKALNSNNLAEPTIKDSSQHFDILTYTGNGTNRTLSGLNFQPDFTWIKNRASGHYVLQDSVRGASKQLFCDVTQAEQTNATNFVTSFTSDGFTSGPSAQGSGDTNSNNSNFVAYCWKGGGTAVSNTDGSITSSVSANTDAGFSIVTYTGTGANATVGHGLNSAPECVLVKDRENGNFHWQMWHTGLSSNDHSLLLNGNDAEGDYNAWQNTAPSNTVVSLGTANGVNASSNDHVMYCWHGVEGYSKFGQYEANNSTDGPFLWCGFKPRWLLIKKMSGTNQWRLWDSARDTYNPRDTLLFPDSSEAEATDTSYYVDFLSNGFKLRNTHSAINNAGGHMFMAFAENPFGGTNTAPLTAV